ncbi:MAG: NUDIX domain-containing protein [Eubacterium sp.]|nr:NUDIX domain-containing protein [Eubacterium sp.]
MDEIWDIYDENRNLTGKTVKRSEFQIRPNEYHIVVHIWIKNDKGEWLISKRTPNKHCPLLWECTGGSALAGEDSLTAALREVKEELGVTLNESKGILYKTYKRSIYSDFCDVWLFNHNCSIKDVVLQPEETCDAMWATVDEIQELINNDEFIPLDNLKYVYTLLGIREEQ